MILVYHTEIEYRVIEFENAPSDEIKDYIQRNPHDDILVVPCPSGCDRGKFLITSSRHHFNHIQQLCQQNEQRNQ